VSAQAHRPALQRKNPVLFESVLNAAFTQVVAADPVAVPLLSRKSSVIVEDSSTESTPDELKELWEGCGGKQKGMLSAFKVHVRWDLLSDSLNVWCELKNRLWLLERFRIVRVDQISVILRKRHRSARPLI
jgi:hypothetical protein